MVLLVRSEVDACERNGGAPSAAATAATDKGSAKSEADLLAKKLEGVLLSSEERAKSKVCVRGCDSTHSSGLLTVDCVRGTSNTDVVIGVAPVATACSRSMICFSSAYHADIFTTRLTQKNSNLNTLWSKNT